MAIIGVDALMKELGDGGFINVKLDVEKEAISTPAYPFRKLIEGLVDAFATSVDRHYSRLSEILLADFSKGEDSVIAKEVSSVYSSSNGMDYVSDVVGVLHVDNVIRLKWMYNNGLKTIDDYYDVIGESFAHSKGAFFSKEIVKIAVSYFLNYINERFELTDEDIAYINYELENRSYGELAYYTHTIYRAPFPVASTDDLKVMAYGIPELNSDGYVTYNWTRIDGIGLRMKNRNYALYAINKQLVPQEEFESFTEAWGVGRLYDTLESLRSSVVSVLSSERDSGYRNAFEKAVSNGSEFEKKYAKGLRLRSNATEEKCEEYLKSMSTQFLTQLTSPHGMSPYHKLIPNYIGVGPGADSRPLRFSLNETISRGATDKPSSRFPISNYGGNMSFSTEYEDTDKSASPSLETLVEALKRTCNGFIKEKIKEIALSKIDDDFINYFDSLPTIKIIRDLYKSDVHDIDFVGRMEECVGYSHITLKTSCFGDLSGFRDMLLIPFKSLSVHLFIE